MPYVPRHLRWSGEARFNPMNRGRNLELIFAGNYDPDAFLDLIARCRERFEFRLFHYCLLSDHSPLPVNQRDPW